LRLAVTAVVVVVVAVMRKVSAMDLVYCRRRELNCN
jgi:hypothetical protein